MAYQRERREAEQPGDESYALNGAVPQRRLWASPSPARAKVVMKPYEIDAEITRSSPGRETGTHQVQRLLARALVGAA